MQKTLLPLALLLWPGATACGTAPAGRPAASPTAATAPTPPAPAPRYDVRGIFDPGMNGIVAFALKVPHGWKLQQSYTRNWINAYPLDQIYVGLASPDGHQVYDGLPAVYYTYDASPMGRQMQQMARQMEQQTGKSSGLTSGVLAPMLPLPYLKQVLLPQLAQKVHLQARVVAEHQDPVKQMPDGSQTASGYVNCVLPSGRKLQVQTTITVMSVQGQGGPFTMWTASNTLIQTDGDLAAAVAQQAAIQKSLVINPAWQRQNQALQSRGMDMNTAQAKASLQQLQAQQKVNNEQFQRRMADQQQQFAQHNANWAAQQHANDQSSQAFRDYLGGQTLYQNAETGQRTRVDNTYSHVYQDGQGNTLGTNAPLSAGHVNWQELQQVELKNY